MKVLITLLGGTATGKSTLTRMLVGEDAKELETELEADLKGVIQRCRVRYTIGPTIAVAGSYRAGSDNISSMDALRQVIDLCWRERDVVITDSLRCTCKLVLWSQEHPLQPAAIFVHLAPPVKANIERLCLRRAARGVVEAELPEKTFWHIFRFRARARMVWAYAQRHYRRRPVRFLRITEETPEQAAELVRAALQGLQRQAWQCSDCSEH